MVVDIPPYCFYVGRLHDETTKFITLPEFEGHLGQTHSGMLLHGLLPDSIDSKIGLVSLRTMSPWSSGSSSNSVGLMLIEFALPLLCVSASCWKYACGHRATNK